MNEAKLLIGSIYDQIKGHTGTVLKGEDIDTLIELLTELSARTKESDGK